MTDTTIKDRAPVDIALGDEGVINLARAMQAYKDTSGRISKERMTEFMFDRLSDNGLSVLKNGCRLGNALQIEVYYIDRMINAAQTAVNMGLVDEVTVPDVPSLCKRTHWVGI